jgi:hypothetical protein
MRRRLYLLLLVLVNTRDATSLKDPSFRGPSSSELARAILSGSTVEPYDFVEGKNSSRVKDLASQATKAKQFQFAFFRTAM